MNWKVIVIGLLIVAWIFCHFSNKHIMYNVGEILLVVTGSYKSLRFEAETSFYELKAL